MLATRQEVPHSVAVTVDKWEEMGKLTRIFATIRVERATGRKAVVRRLQRSPCRKADRHAGAGGKWKRSSSVRIYLDLHVPGASRSWRDKAAFLNALDWRTAGPVKMISYKLLRHS